MRTATDPKNPNLRVESKALDALADGEQKESIFQASELLHGSENPTKVKLPKFSPADLLGVKYLHERADGSKLRAKVIRKLQSDAEDAHKQIRFLIQMGDGEQTVDDVISYTELCDIIEEQHAKEEETATDPNAVRTYQDIIAHQGPLRPNHPDYNGSAYNLLILWDDGSEILRTAEHYCCR